MDFDECIKEDEDKMLSNGYVRCGYGAVCANKVGGYACVCKYGFRAGLIEDQCVDIDECLKQNICQENTKCRNTPGSYSCDCLDGYEGDSCEDIDECTSGTKCHAKAECQNTEGNYTCSCQEGYFGTGFTCLRGECNDAFCPINQKCVSPRTEACECKEGFQLNGDSDCVTASVTDTIKGNLTITVLTEPTITTVAADNNATSSDASTEFTTETEQLTTTETATTEETTSTELIETEITTTKQPVTAPHTQEKVDK